MHGERSRLGRSANRALDLAFPASCAGCGEEGAPCAGSAGRRSTPDSSGRRASRSGCRADVPAPLLQLEWCAPFGGVVRRALHAAEVRGRDAARARRSGEAVARRWARAGAGGDLLVPVPVHAERRRRARLRPGGADRRRRGRRARAADAPRSSSAAGDDGPVRSRSPPARRTNVGGCLPSSGAGGARRCGTRHRSPAAGSSSSTTSSRPARRWPRAPSRCSRRGRDRRLGGDGRARTLTPPARRLTRGTTTIRVPARRSRSDPGVDSNLDGEPADCPRTARCPRERGRRPLGR